LYEYKQKKLQFMSEPSHLFYGNPLAFAIQGFEIIRPGETKQGPFFCIGPIDRAVTISAATSTWGGTLDGLSIRTSVFGYFDSISVDAGSQGNLIAYRTN
jgi:hypothetical protein